MKIKEFERKHKTSIDKILEIVEYFLSDKKNKFYAIERDSVKEKLCIGLSMNNNNIYDYENRVYKFEDYGISWSIKREDLVCLR